MRRTVGELIDARDDAWPQVLEWTGRAPRPVEIIAVEPHSLGEATLFALQVTTRSPMGAIALRSGGILVDDGWLRILGAGHPGVGGGLREWNALDGQAPLDPPMSGGLIVAYDAVGGFFALNGGAWGGQPGGVHYLAPDTYQWSALDLTYSGLIRFALLGDLDQFYSAFRWPHWRDETAPLGPDQAISIYPFLGFEGQPIESRSRRPVPARELWTLHQTLGTQLSGLAEGTAVRVRLTDPDPGDIPAG